MSRTTAFTNAARNVSTQIAVGLLRGRAFLREMSGKQSERQATGVSRHMRRVGDQREAASHNPASRSMSAPAPRRAAFGDGLPTRGRASSFAFRVGIMSSFKAALRLTCAVLVLSVPAQAAERQSISLPQALQRALVANPRVTAAERDIGIAGGLRIQAGVLPNPELSFELDNALGSGPYKGLRSAETNLQLSRTRRAGWQAGGAYRCRRGRRRRGRLAAEGDPTGSAVRDGDRIHYHHQSSSAHRDLR